MVLSINMTLGLLVLVVWLVLCIIHGMVIIATNHWIKGSNPLGLLVFLVLSPVFMWITIYALWQEGAELKAAAKKEVENFVKQCEELNIKFFSVDDATKTIVYIASHLSQDQPYFDIIKSLDEMERKGVITLAPIGSEDVKVYSFNDNFED